MIIALITTGLAFTALIAAKFAAVKLAACVLFAAAISAKLGAVSEPLTELVNLINFTARTAQEFLIAVFAEAASRFLDVKFEAPSDLGVILAR